jgi:hypothetical protein
MNKFRFENNVGDVYSAPDVSLVEVPREWVLCGSFGSEREDIDDLIDAPVWDAED